jgi:hypothetical protein
VGLYASATAADSSFLASRPTNGLTSGSLPLTVPRGTPTSGLYELRLFRGGGFTRLATSRRFAILLPTLTVAQSGVPVGGSVRATWGGVLNPKGNDWIGLYLFSAAPDSAPLRTQVTNGQTTVDFLIPPFTPLASSYELRYFRSGAATSLATSNSFRVEQADLQVVPRTVAPGDPLSVAWSLVPSPTARDWIGLYSSPAASDRDHLTWRYTLPFSGGVVPLTMPASLPAGTAYEIRLFRNGGFTRLATSDPITVTE